MLSPEIAPVVGARGEQIFTDPAGVQQVEQMYAQFGPIFHMMMNPITGQPSVVESWPFNPFIGKTPQSLPFTWADGKPGNVWDELRRLNGGGLTELPDWIGGTKPGADFGMQAPDPRAGVRLNGPAKDRWVQLMTQVVRDHNDDTYAKALQRLMATPEYQAGDGVRGHDGGKADLLRATQQYFQGMATQVLFR